MLCIKKSICAIASGHPLKSALCSKNRALVGRPSKSSAVTVRLAGSGTLKSGDRKQAPTLDLVLPKRSGVITAVRCFGQSAAKGDISHVGSYECNEHAFG